MIAPSLRGSDPLRNADPEQFREARDRPSIQWEVGVPVLRQAAISVSFPSVSFPSFVSFPSSVSSVSSV